MKKAFTILGILVLCLIAFLWFRESRLFSVGMDGFMYPGNDIKTSLMNGGEEAVDYDAVAVTETDDIYNRRHEYYVDNGTERKRVSIDLPVISDKGSKILVFDDEDAITDKFVQNSTFRGAVIADGRMYSLVDSEEVDRERYIFLKNSDKIFTNTFNITINRITLNNEQSVKTHTIPAGSLIIFERNSLKYYCLNEEKTKYVFTEIRGIDLKDEVEISDIKLSYGELLVKLDVWRGDNNNDDENNSESSDQGNGSNEQETKPDNGGDDEKNTYSEVDDKLEVSGRFLDADTYYARFSFYIHDPKGEIVRFPTVEIYDGNRLYSRKTFYSTAEGKEIVGLAPNTHFTYKIYYHYRNEEQKLMQGNLDAGEFWTKDMTGIEPIILQYSSVTPKTNEVTISDLKLGNTVNDRVLRGFTKLVVEVDGQEVKMGSGVIGTLKSLESLNYTLPSILKSNTFYHFEFKAYDVAGNSLSVINGGFDAKTTKVMPVAKLVVRETDFTWFRAEAILDNPDNVNLVNYRYVLLDGDSVIRSGFMSGNEIKEENLTDGKAYQLLLYADYDLDDGYGNRQNLLLADKYVTTTSVEMLGNLRLTLSKKTVTKDAADFDLSINTRTTDARLIQLLDEFTIYLEDSDGEVAKVLKYEGDDLFYLKGGGVQLMSLTGLKSNTDYTMRGEAKFSQGSVTYDVEVALSIREFKTMKRPALVEIIDKFSNASMIDYTVRIDDPDGSITSDRVIMRAERVNGDILGVENLAINEDYVRFTYKKLENNASFEITFTAEGYNEGFTDITAQPNKVLAVERMTTSDGISGTIALESLLRQRLGKNHYEIENLQRWKDVSLGGSDNSTTKDRSYDLENDITFLSVKNGWRYYSYFLPELIGKLVTVSFDAKIEKVGSSSFSAAVTNTNASNDVNACMINNLSSGTYNHYVCTFTVGARGYIGFYLKEESAQNRLTQLAIRKLQIEEGGRETPYERYIGKPTFLATTRVNLTDLNRETTGNDYYIKVYKFDELVQEIRKPLNEDGYVIEDYSDFDAEPNSNYTIRLAVRINGVDYDIASTDFTTEAEIRSVRTVDEFKKMHINGKYYVVEDLDLKGEGRLFVDFFGLIDFQGHRFDMSMNPQVYFSRFYGTIRNVDFHMYFNRVSAGVVRYYWGLTEYNYGTIEKFMLTIEESHPGAAYVSVSSLSRFNFGLIDSFVLHMKVSMYGINSFSPFVLENYGTIRNGYAYGEEGVSLEPHYDRAYESNPKFVGVFAARLRGQASLTNVYSLVDVDGDVDAYNGNLEYVANLVGYADAGSKISHVYSNADGKDRNLSADINWYPGSGYDPNNPSNYLIDKMYYVLSDKRIEAGQDYARKGSTRISPWTLRDVSFQNETLNDAYNAFDVDSYVQYGFYPHVVLSELMPNQPYIPLPIVDEKEKADVVSVLDINQESNSSAIITLNVRNYYARDINDITIDKLTTEILEQTHASRYTKLKIRVSNPTQYLSIYSVRSINNGRVTTYAANERNIEVEMYREIYNVSDWNKINSYRLENHRLMADIDFTNVPVGTLRVAGDFKGKLDGNGHTIRNILINSGDAMFVNVYGLIMNLFVENYSITSRASSVGLISYARRGGRIYNVHVKDISILGNDYMGGLAGLMEGATIRDCSIKNLSLYNISSSVNQALLGGITGQMRDSSLIENSFVQNLDFDIREAPNVYAVGGAVGRVSSGKIDNVFATGSIQSRTPSNGGIIGQAESAGSLTHAYSAVDIFSFSKVDIGGIVGEVDNPSQFVVSNTLSTGAIYTSVSGGKVRRTLGGDTVVSLPNFAWAAQHMNGLITQDTSGEVLLSTEELNLVDNYTRVIELGDAFSYAEIGDSSLPLLLSADRMRVLPNQDKSYLRTYDFEVNYIEIDQGVDSSGTDNAWIYMEINNPLDLTITDIVIDDVIVKQVTQNRNANGTTYYRMEIQPKYYYDSYRLSAIKYLDGGAELSFFKDTKIEMQFFHDIWNVNDWQRINPISSENYRLRADIDFTGVDINRDLYINRLDGFENGFTLSNITITSSGSNVGLFHVINSSLYNITFNNVSITNTGSGVRNTGIVLFQYGRAEKLTFDTISIIANTGSGSDYVGISADNFCSDTRDITLRNIDVKGRSRVGGYAGRMKPFSLTGLNLTDVKVSGTSTYVGGMVGEQWLAPYILQYHIRGKHVVVSGAGYVGGIYGWGIGSDVAVTSNDSDEWSEVDATKNGNDTFAGGITGRFNMNVSTVTDLHVEKTRILGSGNYVAGIAGYADRTINSSTVKNIIVDGKNTASSVGGVLGGQSGSYSNSGMWVGGESEADKVIIRNAVSNVGGVCGTNCFVYNAVVNNVDITATGNNVGGLSGVTWTSYNSLVRNSKIRGGRYVGGAVGTMNSYTLRDIAVVNTEVHGSGIVGGLIGGSNGDTGSFTDYYNNTINATTVEATGNDAGGLIGLLNCAERTSVNKDYVTYYNRRRVYNNIIENTSIVANENAGGLIGNLNVGTVMDGLQSDRIYRNIVAAASVKTLNGSKAPGVFIGNDDNLAYSSNLLRAVNLKVYNSMRMYKGNDSTAVTVANYADNNFDLHSDKANKLLTLDDLKTQNTYTALGFGTGTYNYDSIATHFPYDKNVANTDGASQLKVVLPNASSTNNSLGMGLNRPRMMARNISYHMMPTYSIYPSDVNTINVEFSGVDEETRFTLNGEEYPVDRRVYSFNYNFNQDIVFTMTDGNNVIEETINPNKLRGTLATVNDHYYILSDDGMVITDDIQRRVEAVNIFKNKILTSDGTIINLKTGETGLATVDEMMWIGEPVPLYSFEITGSNVKVFSKYSLIDDSSMIEKQMIKKGAQVELISSSLKNAKTQLIMDSFNNKDFLTILGDDNVIYDLKTKLTYPDNFDKEGIIEISNNIEDYTRIMIVKYENGKVIVFDYQNGEVLYKIQPDEIITPLDYFIQQVTPKTDNIYDDSILQMNYDSATQMTHEIAKGNVVSSENSVPSDGTYITTYDPVKNEYEIYELGKLLATEPLGASQRSVSDIIYGDNTLNSIFGLLLKHNGDNNVAAIIIYSGITVVIVFSMVVLGDLFRKKYNNNDKKVVQWDR